MKMHRDNNKNKDEESKRLWEDLNAAEKDWCCRIMLELIKAGNTHFYVAIPHSIGEFAGMKINYCLRCGRKL